MVNLKVIDVKSSLRVSRDFLVDSLKDNSQVETLLKITEIGLR